MSINLCGGKTESKNRVSKIHKIFKPLPGIVLGTMMLIGGLETIQFSQDVNAIADSPIVLGSKPVNAQSNELIALERTVHNQINIYRRSRGLQPLKLDSRVSRIARNHSQKMAAKQTPFGHDGSKSRYKQINSIILWRGVAENVAYNQGNRYPANTAVKGWIQSSGHHKNIVSANQITGIGVAKNSKGEYYFTQLFVRIR
ncbi:CAP domain-containing protein [Calothrix sp. CCY 0018]|uniref:CAP domain-containing protein n=1 Tax=Calothrix sp. CCY 0018 TaxID=3103864 RepID=UPI0039C70E16